MRRATITLPDDLDAQLESFAAARPAPPSLTSVVQAALIRFLDDPTGPTRSKNLSETVLAHREEIKSIAIKHGATRVRLFGSLARGEAGPNSDIDLLVHLAKGRTLFDLARLRSELEELLGAPVDLVADASLDDAARKHILAEALAL